MVLSASRRTDIPAFYPEWLMNRLRAGYVCARNPFNPSQVRKIEFSPELIDCIVFWTKDLARLLPFLDEIDAMCYKYYFQFTLTPYGRQIERNLRPKGEIIRTFTALGKRLGRDRVFWRYDPIILNENLSVDCHINNFTDLCEQLYEYANSVTISFVDLYKKIESPLIREITDGEIAEISAAFSKIAAEYGLPVKACCEKTDLSPCGIYPASCIDRETAEKLCGHKINAEPDKNQRPGCGCAERVDIGAYNTCGNGCVYCYANYSRASVEKNILRHNPLGDFLMQK
ncbi:MAG: DUF1848 domain-containing protein [Oscillospiraceae bacterium]|nr:DUF1848 domain-containing protein [Oscillospiraceae bacterium]